MSQQKPIIAVGSNCNGYTVTSIDYKTKKVNLTSDTNNTVISLSFPEAERFFGV